MATTMDQKTALRLLNEGAFFIFLNVPEGTEFGIDMKSWNTGERFRGVKMIPAGVHFIFYNSVSSTHDLAPRIGFFHNFKKGEVLVKKWDKIREQISDDCISDSEIVGIKENLKAFDGFLGPYPFDIWDKWKAISSNLNDASISKLTPLCGQVKAALELQSCSDAERPRGKISDVNRQGKLEDLLPDLKPLEGTALRLTQFPSKNYPENATPSEITQHSLDSSFVFESLLQNQNDPIGILGELEFCFISFLVGHSLEAFDQWKKIVTVFCSCDLAIYKYRRLFDAFITVLEAQLQEIPQEFLADIVSNNNFMYINLRSFFRNIQSSNLDGQFKMKVDRFKNLLTNSYMWDFEHLDSEEDDEAPVIVEM